MNQPNLQQALGWAARTLRANLGPFVALAFLVTALQIVQQFSVGPLNEVALGCLDIQTEGQRLACEQALNGGIAPVLFTLLGLALLAEIATIGVVRASVWASLGRKPEFAAMLSTVNLGRYAGFVILQSLLAAVGLLLCILPGIAVLVLLQFGRFAILDRDVTISQACKISVQLVRRYPGPAVLTALFTGLLLLVGGTCFGLLTLVTLPFLGLFVVHVYRQMSGEQVAG